MNRAETIEKLIKEGFSEKTLVKFNDNQLKKFAGKILKEQPVLNIPKDNKAAIAAAQKNKQQFVAYEEKDIEKKKGDLLKDVAKKKKKKAKTAINFKNINEFVNNIVDKEYHSMATKLEMIEMVKSKINGVVSEDLKEKRIPKLPEFLSFDSIVSAGQPEPSVAPNEPDIEVEPDTDTPPSRENDPRRDPFRNPNEEPAENPGTKAKVRRLHKEKLPMAAE